MSLQTIDQPGAAPHSGTTMRVAMRDACKRGVDILLASAMIMVAAPVLAGIACLLVFAGGPVVCGQERLGKGGRSFRRLSFNTRPAPIGRILRHSALEELPLLFNVLRGDMSLVGPHAVTIDAFLMHYTGEAASAYLSVRPGITGPWHVNPRSFEAARRVELDRLYACEHGLAGDMRVLLRTVALLAKGRA
jgi:exopolysaccharide production protein ExoY